MNTCCLDWVAHCAYCRTPLCSNHVVPSGYGLDLCTLCANHENDGL
jgi:hypothetical protein